MILIGTSLFKGSKRALSITGAIVMRNPTNNGSYRIVKVEK